MQIHAVYDSCCVGAGAIAMGPYLVEFTIGRLGSLAFVAKVTGHYKIEYLEPLGINKSLTLADSKELTL